MVEGRGATERGDLLVELGDVGVELVDLRGEPGSNIVTTSEYDY